MTPAAKTHHYSKKSQDTNSSNIESQNTALECRCEHLASYTSWKMVFMLHNIFPWKRWRKNTLEPREDNWEDLKMPEGAAEQNPKGLFHKHWYEKPPDFKICPKYEQYPATCIHLWLAWDILLSHEALFGHITELYHAACELNVILQSSGFDIHRHKVLREAGHGARLPGRIDLPTSTRHLWQAPHSLALHSLLEYPRSKVI